MKIFTKSQIRIIENNANAQGIPFMRMMENAGAAMAKAIRETYPNSNGSYVTVLCGKGKNGGDGFVIARKLYENGYKVAVVLTNGMPNSEEGSEMLMRLRDLPISVLKMESDTEKCAKLITGSDLIIDAIFGIGFSGIADRETALIIKLVNSSNAKVVSVDIPSGVDCDKSEVQGEAIEADVTVTAIALKNSLVLYPAASFAGEVKLVNIGIPEACFASLSEEMYSLSLEDVARFFSKRHPNSHKGDYGKCLIIAGSYEMSGAAKMAASAAVNCGAGLVTLAFPDKAYPAVAPCLNEPVLLPVSSNENGRFSFGNFSKVEDAIEKADCILIGCGMGLDEDVKLFIKRVLGCAKKTVVIDADGINAIAGDIDMLRSVDFPIVLTPHSGEAARLLKTTVEEIESDRNSAVEKIRDLTGATVVLKGAGTLVLGKKEEVPFINTTGNAGMATGGSGDVLSGIIASFIAQGMNVENAAKAAVYIHGLSGDKVSEKYSMMGNTPSKIIDFLPTALKDFE